MSAHFSTYAPVSPIPGKPLTGWLVGYGAIALKLELPVPRPSKQAFISEKGRQMQTREWLVWHKNYAPKDDINAPMTLALFHHLVFALKYEGVNLLIFAKLAEVLTDDQLVTLTSYEPSGQYSRRIWFLLEWVSGRQIGEVRAIAKKGFVKALDESLQYGITGVKSIRHRVINNLPGTRFFCPLISKTEILQKNIGPNLSSIGDQRWSGVRKDILNRAAAILMLKDSRASFTIEGENPTGSRALRWGAALGSAGKNELTKEELERLQFLVIENPRFIQMGFRVTGGFVGEHDPSTGEPMPVHISARHEDLGVLMSGWIDTTRLLLESDFDAILAAASLSFGFVFIHPFEDGNGRIHRYLIQHVLAGKSFSPPGFVLPVSASILDRLETYRKVLEAYSAPLLDLISWKETPDHNIEVLSPTLDYYRFFDATTQAEFLLECILDTIARIVPDEIRYLERYEEFKGLAQQKIPMQERVLNLLVRFLDQNNGRLSARATTKEFSWLTAEQIKWLEEIHHSVFLPQSTH